MSRRRRSELALDAALPVAMMRGEVMFLEQRPGSCFDIFVSGPFGTSAICIGRALRIHGTAAEIAQERAGMLARMSASPLAPGISRELWLWAPWGTMRYFRLEAAGIVELDFAGAVRIPLVKGALAGAMRPRYRKSRKKSGAAVAPAPGPEVPPGSAEGAQAPGTPGPGPAPAGKGVREPAPVRYLRKKAKEKEAREKEAREKQAKKEAEEKALAGTPAGGGEPAANEMPVTRVDPAKGHVPPAAANPAGEDPPAGGETATTGDSATEGTPAGGAVSR